MVQGSNSTAAFLHISQNIIAQRIISLFNGRSLRLPKGSPFRNPQKPIQEKPKKQNQKKQKQKPKKTKNKTKKTKRTKKKQYFGTLGKLPLNFQDSRIFIFFLFFCFFWFCLFFLFFFGFGLFVFLGLVFFGFSWIGFAGIWRLASFLCYTTVEFISLIESSIFRNFYYSWQLMPNLLGLVLVLCFLFA